ncbi:MAG: type I restriction endonuclease subunit R, partial [Erysipelotrichaceae bacterium]|nr:type I restriction endonuclease subunit R [Erysipelotrichaceae bacterium]
ESEKPLKIALIYSYGANDEVGDFVEDENSDDTDGLSVSDRDFLENAINDYNLMFHTNYDTSSDRFQNYYKDVSMRMKNQQIDILIVVNMFLTGFDATTLNTLWVDKNLKYHGLLQAYSRTNRILNSIKTFGNIVCFRNLETATDDALALFSDKTAGGIILLKRYKDYFYGFDENGRHFEGYEEIVNRLLKEFPIDDWYEKVVGEKAEKTFIRLMGALLKLRNILTCFDEFEDILPEITMQDYLSKYNDLYDKYRHRNDDDKEIINDDVVFEIELVKQIEVNIDYILTVIANKRREGATNKEIVASLRSALNSSFALRSKVKLIENFISTLGTDDVRESWETYINQKIVDDLEEIIQSENLNATETYQFTHDSLENGRFDTSGTAINRILPPMSRFSKDRSTVKERVIEKLREFFDRFWDLGINVKGK